MSKRFLTLTLALVVALSSTALVAQTAPAASDKAPRLTVVDPIKDFGTVAKGDKLTWNFTVKNTGTADLEIIAARPACGCTVAEFDKVIKPGQSGKVVANVDTTAFSGPIAKGVTLETNDPSTPTAQVTIHAVVKPYVDAHPAGFVRYQLLQGDAETQTLTLYSEETEPFEIVKVETPQEWIKADWKKADSPLPETGRTGQAQYKLNVTVGGPDAKVGPLAEKIRVITNSKHQPDYWVSVTGVIRPTFRVEPTGVNFGEVAPTDSAATRSVVLRSMDLKKPEAFVVTKAESSLAGVKAEVKPTANKGEYEVTLQVAKDAKVGDLDGTVKIYTSDKINPVVMVPVRGTVKPAVK
jgi:hypothetical protein